MVTNMSSKNEMEILKFNHIRTKQTQTLLNNKSEENTSQQIVLFMTKLQSISSSHSYLQNKIEKWDLDSLVFP